MNDSTSGRPFLRRSLSRIAFLAGFVAGFRYVPILFTWQDLISMDGQNGIVIGIASFFAVLLLFAKVVFGVAAGFVAILAVRIVEKFLESGRQQSATVTDSTECPN